MVWPAPVQKTDWQNADVQEDLHPTAHNDIAITLEQDYAPKIDGMTTDIATNATGITDINAAYTPPGAIKTVTPEFWTDKPISIRTGIGGDIGINVSGQGSPLVDRDTTTSFFNDGDYARSGAEVQLDTSGSPRGLFLNCQAAMIVDLEPGETFLVRVGVQFDGGLWDYDSYSFAYRGAASNQLSPGTLRPQVVTLVTPVPVAGTVNQVNVAAYGYATGGQVTAYEKVLTALTMWN